MNSFALNSSVPLYRRVSRLELNQLDSKIIKKLLKSKIIASNNNKMRITEIIRNR